jgi:hypothetical protein
MASSPGQTPGQAPTPRERPPIMDPPQPGQTPVPPKPKPADEDEDDDDDGKEHAAL